MFTTGDKLLNVMKEKGSLRGAGAVVRDNEETVCRDFDGGAGAECRDDERLCSGAWVPL